MTFPITPDPEIHHVPASMQKTQTGVPVPIELLAAWGTNLLNAIVSQVVSIVTFGFIKPGDVQKALVDLENWWGGFLRDIKHAFTWTPNLPELDVSTGNTVRVTDVARAARGVRRDATRGVTELIPQSRIPSIPVSHLGADSPNLLVGGGFDDAANFDLSSPYVWDGTAGRTGFGTAKTTGDGSSKILYSNPIAVLSGDTFTVSGYVRWANLYSSGTAIQLAVVTYAGNSVVSTTVIGSVANVPTNTTSTSWTNLSGNWNYNFTVPTTVTNIRLKLVVTDLVTAGTVWWDDISAYKTGILTGSLVSGLAGAGTIVDHLQGTLDSAVDGFNGTVGVASGSTIDDLRIVHRDQKQTADNAQSTADDADSIASGYLASGSNLLANPSFEDTRFAMLNNGVLASTTSVPAEPARTGTKSLKLVASASSPYSVVGVDTVGQVNFPCSEDEIIYLEAWVYGKTTNSQTTGGANGIILGVATYNTVGVYQAPGLQVLATAGTALNGDWTKVSGQVTIPAGRASFTPYVQLNGAAVTAGETYYFDDIVVREVSIAADAKSTADTAAGQASSAATGTANLQTSLVSGYTVLTFASSTAGTVGNPHWTVPADISEIYVALFGGGGKGSDGTGGSSGTRAGGSGGVAGGFISQQLDPGDLVAGDSVVCTVGKGTSVGGQETSFGSYLSTSSAFKNYVATPLGLIATGAGPTAGGNGGASQTNSSGSAGGTTVVGVGGGSGGAYKTAVSAGQLPGNPGGSGNNGINFGLCFTGGSGGGGGGGLVSSASSSAVGGAGGSGGAPGGGGGGGGSCNGSPIFTNYGGSGGIGGQGLILVIYKIASTD